MTSEIDPTLSATAAAEEVAEAAQRLWMKLLLHVPDSGDLAQQTAQIRLDAVERIRAAAGIERPVRVTGGVR